jgi:hypothetical protein
VHTRIADIKDELAAVKKIVMQQNVALTTKLSVVTTTAGSRWPFRPHQIFC